MSKIEVFLSLPSWPSQFQQSQQGRDRKTLILVLAFWNFKLKVLKYQLNFGPHCQATIISKFGETPNIYMTNPKMLG